jgi:hypothetical protein
VAVADLRRNSYSVRYSHLTRPQHSVRVSVLSARKIDAEAACWVHELIASVSGQNLGLGMPTSVASGACAASLMSAAVRVSWPT